MNATFKWYETYKAAVLETDWQKMEERIRAAKSAIAERQHEFSLDHGGTPEERQAIANALNSLRVLQMDHLPNQLVLKMDGARASLLYLTVMIKQADFNNHGNHVITSRKVEMVASKAKT